MATLPLATARTTAHVDTPIAADDRPRRDAAIAGRDGPRRQLFIQGLDDAIAHYRADVARVRERRLTLSDVNLDTGRPTRGGAYEPADDAYAALLEKLDERHFAGVSPALRADILRYYHEPQAPIATERHECKREKIRQALARLEAVRPAEREGGSQRR